MKPHVSIHNDLAVISYLGESMLLHKNDIDQGVWLILWLFYGNEYET